MPVEREIMPGIIGHYLSVLVHITEHPLDKNSQNSLMPVSIADAHFLGISDGH